MHEMQRKMNYLQCEASPSRQHVDLPTDLQAGERRLQSSANLQTAAREGVFIGDKAIDKLPLSDDLFVLGFKQNSS